MNSTPFILSIALEPKTRTDQQKMGIALSRLAAEDATCNVHTDETSGQTIVSGMGESQLAMIIDGMMREYGFEANVGKPQVAYRETIRKFSEAEGKYIRQTGGVCNYGHVKIRVEPNERGKGFEFLNHVKRGVLPGEYIKPAEEGIREAMRGGVLAGYEIVDVKATLFDGSYHDVDSNEMAFRIAGSIAFKEAARKAAPVLLEPVMSVEVVVREECVGMIMDDLNARRCRIEVMEAVSSTTGLFVVKATGPLAGLIGYAAAIRGLTRDRAKPSMEFKQYEVCLPRRESDDEEPYGGVAVPKGPNPRGDRFGADFEQS